MGTNKKYKNPPIIEAVCEFRLTGETPWDLTVPGLVYERIRNDFPEKEQRIVPEMRVTQSSQGIKQQMAQNERMMFLTKNRKMFVQVGTQLLAVNCLKPYPTWTDFKPKIEMAYDALANVVNIKGLERIGLRYINRIDIPESSINLRDYFGFRPYLSDSLPYPISDFIVGCVIPFIDGRDSCKIQLTDAVSENKKSSAFVLDLDYFLAKPNLIETTNGLEWVEQGHQQIEILFEGIIKDRLREIFQELK